MSTFIQISGQTSSSTNLKGVHTLRPLRSGQYTNNALSITASGNMTPFQNTMILTTYLPATNVIAQSLSIFATNNPASGNLCRIVVYSDNNGYAKDKLFESSDLSMSTSGVKTALSSISFNAGTIYWLGYITNYSGSTQIASLAPASASPTFVTNTNAGAMWSIQGYSTPFTSPAPDTLIEGSITQPFVFPAYVVIQHV
jgi:hypothetical protein